MIFNKNIYQYFIRKLMKMKITKIKKLSSGKYNLVLDNKEKFITYDEVILNNNLLFNKEIDSEILNKLNIDTKYYNIYNKIIKLISVRIRSEKEIYDYLEKNNIETNEQNKIIEKLKNNGLINDENFVRAFISDKLNFSNDGPNKIRNMLLEHNISNELIDSELSKIDQSIYLKKINKLINKKIKINKKYSDYVFKQKITADLKNCGYYYDDLVACLQNINVNNDSLIDEYYQKLYNKLKHKYGDSELDKKIKEKLYQKGFSLSEITDFYNKK